MDSYNQSIGSSNITYTEAEIPLFITYLNMVVILMVTTIVIYPSVIFINVIWKTRELHTKYYFFVANLLTTDIIAILVNSAIQYLIAILYLLDLRSDSANVILRFLVILIPAFNLMTILLPITLAIERIIVIGFPYRHRSIMTTKTVICILAVMWGLSLILTIIITIIVPVDIVWPFAAVNHHITVIPFFVSARLTSAAFTTAANVFLQYQVTVSNRKAKENERLGNEEEEKQFQKLVKHLRAQAKLTITLLFVGGIEIIGNMFISFMYTAIGVSVEPSKIIYFKQFLMYPLVISLLASHPLVYGLYMKKIRKRLPNCTVCNCQGQWNNTCNSRVTTLHQQP